MAYVITQPCIGSKDASCVEVCPVDCIHPAPHEQQYQYVDHLFINPSECIDCGACEAACPSSAIYATSVVPRQWSNFIAINAHFYGQRVR